MAAAAREHRASPAFLLPNALLDVVSLQMPILLITAWFGSDDAGQFSMAWRILWLPIALVGAAVGQVFYQRFAQMQSDPAGARRLLLNTWKTLLLLGGPPTLLVLALGEPVFAFVLGDEWREAGAIASIIAPMLLALLVVGPTSAAMIALGLQRYLLWFGLAAFCYRPLCLWIGYRMGDLHTGLLIYTIVEILQIGCYQLVLLRALRARPAAPPE
jgi:O-antigen/teichoic acid export membrane protein